MLPLRLPMLFVALCPGALLVPCIPAALFVWPLFPIGVRELLAVPERFIVLLVPGRFMVLFVLCEGTFERCAGCDGRLGAEL